MPSLADVIPERPDDLTSEWLTAVLQSRGVLSEARVTGFQSEVLGVGKGFVGSLVRVALELDRSEADAPATLIAKFPTGTTANRAVGEATGSYEREIRFYEELADSVRLATPRCYYSAMDPGPFTGREERLAALSERCPTWLLRLLVPLTFWMAARSRRRYVLLLEDLAPAHVGDQITGCDVARAEVVLRALARAQAAQWNSRELTSELWLMRIDLVARPSRILCRRNHRSFIERYRGRLPPDIGDVTAWLLEHDLTIMEHLGSPPLALLHGDFRLDNLFFGGDGQDLRVVDWQGVGVGRAAVDAGYFITGNLEVDVALASEEKLVRAYHDELLAGGVADYDYAACCRDYELSKLWQLHRWMGGGQLVDLGNERGARLLDCLLERLIALQPRGDLDALIPRAS